MRRSLFAVLTVCALTSIALSNTAVAEDAAQKDRAKMRQLTAEEMVFRSSKLADLEVRNPQNEKLGELNDLILDAHTGQILYGILDTGFGGKNIPVPWTAVRLERVEDTFFLVLNKNKDQLANAPTFDSKRMSDVVNNQWKDTVDKFFGVQSAARPIQTDGHQHK